MAPPVRRSPWRARVLSDRLYVVSLGEDAGRISAVPQPPAGLTAPQLLGRLCYRELEGRGAPCPGCPVFERELCSEPVSGAIEASHGVVRLATAEREGDRALVRVVSLGPRELGTAVGARLHAIALEHDLSPQEVKVLELLIIGRRPAEVGTVLGISERTAKYHQANLLEKLGLDSRHDLLKLVMRE